MTDYFVHSSAFADEPRHIGAGTKIWHFSHVMPEAKIGTNCILGQNVHVGSEVVIGNSVKIQNNVSVYTGTVIEDEVFLGPSCVLTNVTNPRSQINRHDMFEQTLIKRGATVGANATIVCGSTIGCYAFIAAGAVVSGDVPNYALMRGVPARPKGFMSRHGYKLNFDPQTQLAVCEGSGLKYELKNHQVKCLDVGEEDTLSENLTKPSLKYRDQKNK